MNNDLISRDYIVKVYNRVKVVCKNCDNYNGVRCRACDIGDELLDLQDIIDNAPTVETYYTEDDILEAEKEGYERGKNERPQGEWELHGMIYYCSECGHYCGESGDNFCGNCGADMRKGGAE